MNNTQQNPEQPATDPIIKKGRYLVNKSTDPEAIGYYANYNDEPIRISNFYVNLHKCNKGKRDQEPFAYYQGDVVLPDGNTIDFKSLSASYFADYSSFHKYFENLCGSRAMIYGSPRDLAKAIRSLNSETEELEEKEFGFNDELTEYYTEDLIISAENILEKETPIKYNECWGNNKLGFKVAEAKSIDEMKSFIIEKLLVWDEPEIMYSLLAFTFFPVIYPSLRDKNPNKFYLMLKGPSGSGKSQMSKWMQGFYGTFISLFSWTSTDTSINVIGTSFKDALFAVDDLKQQNFRSENDIKKIQGMIQNYSDGNGRQRARVDLKLRDERIIKGHLLVAAEDLVFTEASTIARGIIIDVQSKPDKKFEVSEIEAMAKKFSAFTPKYIQYVLQNFTKESVADIFDRSHKWISEHPSISNPDISSDNLPRLINNYAALKTSWEIFSGFLFSEQLFGSSDHTKLFNDSLIKLLLENINRISIHRPDAVFESSLYEMLENGTFALLRVKRNGDLESTPYNAIVVGHYSSEHNCKPKIVININRANIELNRRVPNYAISTETLIAKLKSDGKITLNDSKKVSFNKFKATGAEWIGKFPRNIIGLQEIEDPVTQANAILNESIEENVLL